MGTCDNRLKLASLVLGVVLLDGLYFFIVAGPTFGAIIKSCLDFVVVVTAVYLVLVAAVDHSYTSLVSKFYKQNLIKYLHFTYACP